MSCSLHLNRHFMADGFQENETEHIARKEEMENRIFPFPVALRPNASHGLRILEVSRSHTATHHSR